MPVFPFSALVGHENLKRALLLGIIQPGLGGVLIRGTKGVAKSTAVRALAGLLPPIDTLAGCPFHRRPGESIPAWPLPGDPAVVSRPVPLIELPLGASEDRVLGELHLERALRGERTLEPGLLAAANRGLLYIDEVNLLPDHLVDILLDASASGVHRLEREGLSLTHPARFLLIGTMNPEEGDLRPQLLDRFGLAVDVADLTDPALRAEAVRRRLAFEADPAGFAQCWHVDDAELARRIVAAQRLLPELQVRDEWLHALSERCIAAGVEGLRADLTLCQAACAWAAFEGRKEVQAADIDAVAELALVHRRRMPPDRGGGGGSTTQDGRSTIEDRSFPNLNPHPNQTGDTQTSIPDPRSSIFDIAGQFPAKVRPPRASSAVLAGKWRSGDDGPRGPNANPGGVSGAGVAWSATLWRAALRQGERGWDGGPMVLRPEDLRFWRRREPAGRLLLFLVDASGSMGAYHRMRHTKAAILALLVQAYQHRDRIALLTFRGNGTELILPPMRGLARARQALEQLAVGGTTPLAHGLAAARRLIAAQHRRQPRLPIWTVILTDGRTNVPLAESKQVRAPGDRAWRDALHQARQLAATNADVLVVDTETGWPRFGRANQLATALDAEYQPLEAMLARRAAGFSPAEQEMAS